MRLSRITACAASLALAATAARAADPPLRPFTIGIGGMAQIGYVTGTLADRIGYYRQEGLEVTLDNFQGGTKSVEALVGGSVDAMIGAYDNAVILQTKGVYLTTVFTFVHHYGYVFGMKPERASQYHSPKDLKGLKIGVTAPGSSTESLVRILLGKAGLTFDDIASIGVGTGQSAIAALLTDRIDGLVTGDPEATRMAMMHEFAPLVDTRTKDGMDYAYGGEAAGAGSLVLESYAKAHPDMVQAYVNALYRAHRWLLAASPDEIAATVPQSYWGGDEALYKAALKTNHDSFTPDGRTTAQKAKVTYESMVHAGRVPESLKIEFARTYDDSFVDRAIASSPH
ncbi:MAG TPA: ABC transporter substrate-binding protein [Stellaceae bacterium]|nr:ABC transporter substrate-binding protein [Stellaceae bacterium]